MHAAPAPALSFIHVSHCPGNPHCRTFKNRAPRAVREIKKFAAALLNTKDVRIDTDVNRYVWNKGIRNVPFRIRVKLSRRRSEEEDAKEQFYTLVEVEDVDTFKGVTTKKVAADEE